MASLRDSYSDPSTSGWSFLPVIPPPNSTTISPPPHPPPTSSYQWSTRPSHNSIFDLSPSLDLNEPSGVDVSLLLRSLVASALLQYTSSAIAMPWEVGKMLLQVQWVPRDVEKEEGEVQVQVQEEEDAFSDSEQDDESYFADPNNPTARRPPVRQADEQGYIVRHSILEEGLRPEYIIPVGSADGVWAMIKRVGRFRAEGWFALWKGLLTSCISDVISSTMQPVIHNILFSIFYSSSTTYLNQPPLLLPVASHLITGFILSPLDLIRTRLIVQSFLPRYRSYSGPLDALSQILRDEGGFRGMYLHPHLLIPTLLDNTLRPLVSLVLPQLLSTTLFTVSPETSPVTYSMFEMAASCLGLLITLPFETVRRRLQVQTRGNAKPIKGCVELRPVPYNGVVDAFWHILTEERSDLPVKREDEGGWMRYTGIGQLYRGLGMRLGASAIVFLLTMVSGGEEIDGGWAEL